MSPKKRLLSGFQDFLPSSMMARNAVIETVKRVYERFGFLPQETPCLEYADLLLGKYGENQKLVYEFTDKGNRRVAMRYDLTVPLGRIIETYGGSLTFPYRRYQIGMVWRADKPGKGRYREFMQMDADIVGDDSLLADTEIILMGMQIMRSLKVRAAIRINSRQVLDALVDVCGLESSEGVSLLRVIDKFDKIGADGVKGELVQLAFSGEVIGIVEKYLSIKGDNAEVLALLKELLGASPFFEEGCQRLSDITRTISKLGVGEDGVRIDPTIARGLDYYTGLIFETTFLDDPEFGSICSGGRYDKLIRLPSGEFAPTIGISIGLDRLFSAMESVSLIAAAKTTTEVFIINFGEAFLPIYLSVAKKLRDLGLNVEVSAKSAKLAKQMKLANAKGVPYVILMGEDELAAGKLTVKDMQSGQQETVLEENLTDYLITRVGSV